MTDGRLSRRDVLAVVGLAAGGGCSGRPETTDRSTTRQPTNTDRAGDLCAAAFGTDTVTAFGGTEDCPNAEILSVASEPRPDTPTETGETASDFRDYVVVAYELTGDRSRTLEGCVDAVGGRVSFRREVTPAAGRQEIEIGPFEHLGVNRTAVRFAGCRESYRGP